MVLDINKFPHSWHRDIDSDPVPKFHHHGDRVAELFAHVPFQESGTHRKKIAAGGPKIRT